MTMQHDHTSHLPHGTMSAVAYLEQELWGRIIATAAVLLPLIFACGIAIGWIARGLPY
jgi:hypothetical protein